VRFEKVLTSPMTLRLGCIEKFSEHRSTARRSVSTLLPGVARVLCVGDYRTFENVTNLVFFYVDSELVSYITGILLSSGSHIHNIKMSNVFLGFILNG
jgi:hypothetical protein